MHPAPVEGNGVDRSRECPKTTAAMKVENTQTGPAMFGKRSEPAETLSYARRKQGVDDDQRAQEATLTSSNQDSTIWG